MSTLTTASGTGPAASVVFINGGPLANVFWQISSSATIGTYSSFYGSILTNQSITVDTGATIGCGRALALNAAVTLDDNTISTDGWWWWWRRHYHSRAFARASPRCRPDRRRRRGTDQGGGSASLNKRHVSQQVAHL